MPTDRLARALGVGDWLGKHPAPRTPPQATIGRRACQAIPAPHGLRAIRSVGVYTSQ